MPLGAAERQLSAQLLQVASGVSYLHNFKPTVIHGDLKGVSTVTLLPLNLQSRTSGELNEHNRSLALVQYLGRRDWTRKNHRFRGVQGHRGFFRRSQAAEPYLVLRWVYEVVGSGVGLGYGG